MRARRAAVRTLVLACLTAALTPTAAVAATAAHPALALVERSTAAARTNPEDSRRDAEAALALLGSRPDADLELRARLLLCEYHSERNRAAAEREATMASALLPHVQRHGLRAGVLACQGEILETAGDNARAEALYGEAVGAATAAHDDEMLAGALFQRGFVLGLRGEYSAGLGDLRRAESLYEKMGMPQHSLTVLNGIATLFNRMGDYSEAREIYARALKAQSAAGMHREVAITAHNLGRAHERLGEWDAAKRAFEATLTTSRELGYARGEAYALRGLAAVANATGDPGGALRTLERATELQHQTTDARLRAQIQLARGTALHRIGHLSDSAGVLEDAQKIFRQADSLEELAATSSELAMVRAEMGDWRPAFEHLAEAKAVAEKLLRNQLDQRFATLKVQFDTAATRKENALLQRENRTNEKALAQSRRVRQLQAIVLILAAALVTLLVWLVLHQRRSTLRLRALAMTDELTGMPNRRAALGRLDALLREPAGLNCSVLIVDIDHFKSINDHYGHPAGDEVLKIVAAELRRAVREPGFFGRLGGEEFLVVLPDTHQKPALVTAELIRERVRAIDTAHWFPDRRRITVSVGVAASRPDVDTPSGMLQRADAALYAAKRAGRDCVRADVPPDPEALHGTPLPT